MEVEEAVVPQGIPQVNDRELPHYAVDAMAVQNASGSLEIMGQLVLNEWELLRFKIRELGAKIRQMSSNVAAVTVKRLWNQLLSLLRRHGDSIPRQFELDAALILNEMEKAEVERPPPRDTLADLRRVLLEDADDVDVGIVQKKPMPAWRALPPPRRDQGGAGSPNRESDMSAYQLFNRPMTVVDDDFDRSSLPSNLAHSEYAAEKILSLEAQLAMLTNTLSDIMKNGVPQRSSRPVSRSHSRASLYQNSQMNASMNGSFGALPSHHHHHHQSLRHHLGHSSPSPTSDDDGVYMADDSASSYASPSHMTIPLAPPLPPSTTVLSRRQGMMGDATSTIPVPPPLPPFVLQAPPTRQQQSADGDSSSTPLAASASSSTLVPFHLLNDEDVEADLLLPSSSPPLSPPFSPLPSPPLAVVQHLQHQTTVAAAAAAANLEHSGGRSFLDDINGGNFALRKTSSQKSPTNSLRSSTSGEETEQDENTVGPLVKPTTKQLLSRKVSLKRTSNDRSPGGTPQNRNRRRAPSLGQDGGRALPTGDYFMAALAKQFNTIRVNEDDDDQSMTAGEQSWLDE
ncbi:hypothetical protein PENTCL1PPCAC_19317 [Pristionchus entomophagus]|uniref:Uncharacterized protein n=1 Tax=Pristionchus entomophagus TaxID=358040 RepID=A0AAV5TSJ6_9BILA|nr:hypothetical protein PENTCL1PPCAC_19317 [Pristionchus entomophagus]